MKSSFRLHQHPRRWAQPLSGPPAGYFEQLPRRIMAQVAVAPARRALLPAWLLRAPAYVRTGLASTLLLGTFAASLWLGGAPLGSTTPLLGTASLDGVPREEMLDYLTNEAHLTMLDLAELPTPHLGITKQYLQPSTSELAAAYDAQPTDAASAQ